MLKIVQFTVCEQKVFILHVATEDLQWVHSVFGLGASSLQNAALKSDEDHMFTLTGKLEMGFHQTECSLALSTGISADEKKSK